MPPKTSAPEDDDPFSKPTLADYYPRNKIVQYIIMPLIGRHPILTIFVYLSVVITYTLKCDGNTRQPTCGSTLHCIYGFLLTLPISMVLYIFYLTHNLRPLKRKPSEMV